LPRAARWPANLGIVVLDVLVVRLVLPTTAVGLALWLEGRDAGLMHALDVPPWLAFGISVVLLDLAIYLQHVLFHAVPLLWRLHRVHHADVEFDVTAGLRFHPLEILLSAGIKLAVIAVLGPPAAAVVVFELLLNGLAMFNHGNVRLPPGLERRLRWVVVTPDMHRVHHSWHADEHRCNFGFNLAFWDRLFGTYRAQPRDGHEAMTIGLSTFRDPQWRGLHRMLLQPFVGERVPMRETRPLAPAVRRRRPAPRAADASPDPLRSVSRLAPRASQP
jgi:sterol desaturase/sphingolipid hydroxylase (fatty acid hydroxylase superfamily)